MKYAIVLLSLGAFSPIALAADNPLEAGPVNVPGEHIILTENTLSPDGRYAAGWTVQPKKGKPAVKWSNFGKDDSFFDDYLDNEGYLVTDVIVDLTRLAVAARLQFREPYFDRKGHGALEVLYGPDHEGHRYAIALSDSKWNASDVVLVDLAADGATQADIHKTLDSAVASYVKAHQKRSANNYLTDYQISSLPELGVLTGFSDDTTVRLPFTSLIPKADNAPGYSGTILLHLTTANGHPHAEPGQIRESGEQANPTSDDPRIVAADKDLNAAYAAVRSKLDAAGKTKLVAEQREWIRQRDDKIAALSTANSDKTLVDNPRIAADHLLLELTKERTAALRAR